MKIDETVKGHSNLITGIAVISLASFFVAFVLVLGGYSIFSPCGLQTLGLKNIIENSSSFEPDDESMTISGNDDVTAAETCIWDDIDTEQGSIVYTDYWYDNPLPLCSDDWAIHDWYIIAEVHGGYEPLDGVLNIYQEKIGWVGSLNVNWTWIGYDDCYDYWVAYFTPIVLPDPICLESNQFPDIDCSIFNPADCWISNDGEIPDLNVWFEFSSEWTSCGEADQNFQIMLSQKSYFPELCITPS